MALNNFHKDLSYQLNNINQDIFKLVHNNGFRQTIEIPKKDSYSFNDIINIINHLDTIWENSITSHNQNTYVG